METKGNFFKKAAIFLTVISVFALIGGTAYAEQECRLIQISMQVEGAGSHFIISPQTLTVPVGSCTVWLNFFKKSDQQVTVSFRENAKACEASTVKSKEFGMFDLGNGQSCYLSRPLGLGQSSSLIWNKPGKYKYTIQYATKVPSGSSNQVMGDVLGEGVIIVK
jgi:hypothetical protein